MTDEIIDEILRHYKSHLMDDQHYLLTEEDLVRIVEFVKTKLTTEAQKKSIFNDFFRREIQDKEVYDENFQIGSALRKEYLTFPSMPMGSVGHSKTILIIDSNTAFSKSNSIIDLIENELSLMVCPVISDQKNERSIKDFIMPENYVPDKIFKKDLIVDQSWKKKKRKKDRCVNNVLKKSKLIKK